MDVFMNQETAIECVNKIDKLLDESEKKMMYILKLINELSGAEKTQKEVNDEWFEWEESPLP